MNHDIFFMPLGGGQRVGASCYYLRLGRANIILDAGIGMEKGMIFEPDIHALLTSPYIQSLNQINQIYISHAHVDHVGYLIKLLKSANMPLAYMTEMTALLSGYQLYDRNYIQNGEKTINESERMAAQHILNRVISVSYMQTLTCVDYHVTFLPAGHIPGAMMLLFQYKNRKILYTGDYSLSKTPLTDGCMIPDNLMNIDTVILCGLHAKHPYYKRKKDSLYKTIEDIYYLVCVKKFSVLCRVQQLSKGIEFLKMLNERNSQEVEIYLDDSIMPIVQKMEQLRIPVLEKHNHPFQNKLIAMPHILITAKSKSEEGFGYEEVKADFSLHEDFSEMVEFLEKINPRQAVLVHCASEYHAGDDSIEQVIMRNGNCRTQFLFAEEKEFYQL